jgi:hypothetical protein
VSSICSLCYALAGFLHKILSPLARKSESCIKNLGHFIQLLKPVNLQSQETLISFDVVNLFTNVPVDGALHVIRNKLHNDDMLVERSVLQVKAIMELLEVCLRTTYFQVDDKSFKKKTAWLWGALYHPSLVTYKWSILRHWLFTRHNTNHSCGSSMLMTHLWSGLMAQSSYIISSTTSIV